MRKRTYRLEVRICCLIGGLIEIGDGFLRLTGRGLELQNAVVLELVENLEAGT